MPNPSPAVRWLIVPLACLWAGGCDSPPVEGKKVGDVCPEIAGEDVDGKRIKLSDYRGKVVLVNFWGTWCPPCRKLLPIERAMVTGTYRDRPFVLLGVAQDSADTLREFQKDNPTPWPNIVDSTQILSKQWNVGGFPSAILVDHQGVIRGLWLDGFDPNEVWAAVDEAVRKAEGS